MRRGLQMVMVIGGVVAITTGLVAIIGGIDTFPGSPSAENPADNEGRFLNGIWVGFGVLVLWAVPRVERETTLVRILAAAIFLGGLARLASIIDVGEPADMQYVLMGIELVLGPLLIGWQALVSRQAPATGVSRV